MVENPIDARIDSSSLQQSKGKGPEVALESEGVQESWRCDSCVRQNTECLCIKVSANNLRFSDLTDNLVDRMVSLLPLMPRAENLGL